MNHDEQPTPALGYADWKGWGGAGFGVLSSGDADYFARETREIARHGQIRNVLEVGFGNGAFLTFCRSQDWKVTGTELLPELIELAQASGFAAYPADGLTGLPDGAFDLIVAIDVFEHVPAEQSIGFLTTIAQKLSSDGAVLLRFPNVDSWIGNPLQNGDVTHVNAIGALKMQYYAETAGLRITSFRATKRRRFKTSLIHGLHAYTAGILIKLIAGITKALYFPDLRVVLSSSSVVCVLRRAEDASPGDRT